MPTMTTVVSVASSIATHITPILLAQQREIEGEHQRLVERVVEPQEGGRHAAGLDLVRRHRWR